MTGREPMGPRAIIVDDQRALAEVLAERLVLEGYTTTVTTTAAQALAAVTTQNYSVGFIDLQLPDMGGFALAAELKERFPAVKIFLVTGHANCVDDANMMCRQVDGILPKPWKPAELEAILRNI